MTNLFLITIVLTNWAAIPGDWKRENGTNFIRQELKISTNTFVVEARTCYASNLVHEVGATNGATRWLAVGVNAAPPLPGVKAKE